MTFRSGVESASTPGQFELKYAPANWDPKKTAVIICDMWDKHWCSEATIRVTEMAPRMNQLAGELRKRGVLIIHCPSETMEFYKDHPARKRAIDAPHVESRPGPDRKEGPYPIEVVNGGCSDDPVPHERRVWNRQIDLLDIATIDAITDNGNETYNLLKQNGIENLLIMGVHTNMCILNRPFAIKAMVRRGLNVALVRDMTDTMYSPKGKPHVDHFAGNDLINEWIERYWCPTITSDQVIGGEEFTFAEDRSKNGSPAPSAQAPAAPVPFEPTSSYDLRKVEGWPVYVNQRLVASEPQLAADALRLLEFQLYDVARRVPAEAVAKLRQIPIWLELDEPHHPCAVYHPDVNWLKDNGMNPDKARCVELSHARSFLTWTREQPMMLLHELAHGYHDRFLDGGNRNPRLAAAYERAVKSGDYAKVLTKSFRRERAYGMTNPMEFFAEVTEAYFGTNDIYPFVAAELKEHDPETYSLVGELWGVTSNASNAQAKNKPHLVIVASEDEYRTHETLPAFANEHLVSQFRISTVFADPKDPNGFTNTEALKDADVAIFSIRRRTPPAEQMKVIRQYLESGKPLLAIRTSSHAFAGRGETPVPEGHQAWPTFDREVLGCRYEGHYGNKDQKSPKTIVWVAEGTSPHAILSNVHRNEAVVPSWLYKNREMGEKTNVLQWGRLDNSTEKEPVSWTNTTPWGGKVFYTMLGHPDDFALEDFRVLLKNAASWAIEGQLRPAN